VAGLGLSATPSTITGITGWTRVTAGSGASIALLYLVSAGGLSSDLVTLAHASVTASAQGGFASFNGDDQGGGGGQPYAKRFGGVPHNGFRRRGVW
jgi:hypothetical protein